MKRRHNIQFSLSIFLILFFSNQISYAQKQAVVSDHLKFTLITIDSLFKIEQFDRASIIIDSLQKTENYHKKKFDRLAIDYRYAQLLFENEEGEKSIYLLLDGLNNLKNNNISKLYYNHNTTLGKIFYKEKNYENSIFYIKSALKNAETRKDTQDIQEGHFSIGKNFNKISQSIDSTNIKFYSYRDSSIHQYEKVISFPINYKTYKFISKSFNNLGLIEFDQNNYSISKKYFNQSLDILKRFNPNDTFGRATLINNLANTFYVNGEFDKAIEQYNAGYNLLTKAKLRRALLIKASFLQNIAWSYGEMKNYQLAYEYQEKATEMSDSLSVINRSRKATLIEAKYLEAQRVALEKNKRLKMKAYLLSISMITILLCFVAYFIYTRLRNKQQKAQQKIERLKYKALNAQMNPHFINNLLICIHDLINKNKKEAAIFNLTKFNTLTNLILQSTKSNLISLNEELHMLRLYLELQQVRFNNLFEYNINTHNISDKKLNHIKIPPLILQPLVENSIVHGFKNITGLGKINIELSIKNEDYLVCTIQDNGKTTTKLQVTSKSGISHKNIKERLLLINTNKKLKRTLSFSFIKDKLGQVNGTKTKLTIPLIFG